MSAGHRSAWLEIGLDAIGHNVEVIRQLVAPAAVAPVIKADAYGHGVEAVADALTGRVEAFCVATIDEAIALRARVRDRVIVLYPVPPAAAADAARARVELAVMSEHDLEALRTAVRTNDPIVDLQLGVESGMHRGGVPAAEVARLAERIAADPRFRLRGVWSHLASPEDAASSRAQVGRFEAATSAIAEAGVPVPQRHLAASGGIFTHDAPALDMVRPGLAIYGLLDEGLPLAADAVGPAAALRPAMALKARAVAFSDVPAGSTVGYGGTWTAPRAARVAILPVGYGDGYLRGAQPGAQALVRGVHRSIVGRVSMDAVAVDVTDAANVGYEDEFVLLGTQAGETISAAVLARARNTIAWEVLSAMAPRLDRVYYPSAGPARAD